MRCFAFLRHTFHLVAVHKWESCFYVFSAMVLLEVLRAADNDMSVFHQKCLPDLGGVCFKRVPWGKQNNGHKTSYMFYRVGTGFLSYIFMSVCWVFSLLNKISNTLALLMFALVMLCHTQYIRHEYTCQHVTNCQISASNGAITKHSPTRLQLSKSVSLRHLGSMFTYSFLFFCTKKSETFEISQCL